MSCRRRRANDFTNSLNSFQHSEFESDTLYSISPDCSDEITNKNNPNCNDIMHSSKYSTILAGSSAKDSLTQNSFVSSVTSSEVQYAPDLNERIDLFHVEDSYVTTSDDKENNNPQYSLKDKGTENNDIIKKLSNATTKEILVSHNNLESNTINGMSNRDSNDNVNENKPNVIDSLESSASKATFRFNTSPIYTNTDKLVLDSTSGKECAHNEPKKFEVILCSLDNQLNQLKEVSHSEKIFKRLSEQFVRAPRNFTEKLLTIIEETVINNDDDTCNASAITLSRLTAEFKKMCKFIEDESAPEWPVSPLTTPPCQVQVHKSPEGNRFMKANKHVSYNSPTSTSVPTTPISGIDILRRRFLNKISKNNSNGSIDSINSESSNISFERLEAQCKRLFPEEKECSRHLRQSLSESSLLSMSQIQHICENQMAALNGSNIDGNDKKSTLSVPNLLGTQMRQSPSLNKPDLKSPKLKKLQNESKNTQHNTSCSMKKSEEGYEKTDFNKMKTDNFLNSYRTLDPDELEKTLLQDIADKRKRCLDTVRLITEINADPEAVEAHKTLKMSPLFADDNESNSLTHDENMFLNTLMSCKDYQTYLEKRKPLFELLQNSNPCTSELSLKGTKQTDTKCEKIQHLEKKVSNGKQTPNAKGAKSSRNVPSPNLYKSPLLETKCAERKEKADGTKPKLFVTPGKTPPSRNNWRKKEYFPTMNNPAKSTMERYILKSPHAEGLYRLNYTTIMSPVGMYIRGTDMQLLKNVHAKTDNVLLTPVKNNTKATPSRNSRQNTPSTGITKTQGKAPLKLNLSPKIEANCAYPQEVLRTKSSEGDNTPKSRFILPKVSYKLPLQVKMIKENKSLEQRNRVKKLLEAAQSKVVIRHEGRVNSVKKGKNTVDGEIYEINYAPENESIHIEQVASKTNFVHRR